MQNTRVTSVQVRTRNPELAMLPSLPSEDKILHNHPPTAQKKRYYIWHTQPSISQNQGQLKTKVSP